MNLALASLNLLKESGSRADAIIDIAEPEPGPDEDIVVEVAEAEDEAPTAWEIREADPLVLDDDDDEEEEEETDA